ncbi:hypothetical protein BC835DRAFT_1357011 [Cytidiella melzeri]|nr:hypothetical protein BC835DRAFT_1357011 [Cytidiella melzeri]
MVGTTCTICLDDVKSPVSIPCGHLHCEGCLVQYVEQHDDVTEAPCPTCRAPFCIATPDLRFVPQKYHKYILPTVRRVYLSQPAPQTHPENVAYLKSVISALEERTETLEGSNVSLRGRVSNLEKRVVALTQDKGRLMDRCEAGMATIQKLGEKEREARHEKEQVELDLEALRRKYESVKSKYKALKHAKPSAPSPMKQPASTKRTSAQAALDADTKLGDSKGPGARLILPIPKRPRMAFGWWPTVGEVPSEAEDDKRDVKLEAADDELEYDSPPVKMEDDEDTKPSLSALSSGLSSAPTSFPKIKEEPVQTRNVHSVSRHSSQPKPRRHASASYKTSDNESDDEEEAFRRTAPIPRLDVTALSTKSQVKKVQKLKPSGLSRVFQGMDVDDSDYSPSTLGSSPRMPTPGPSTRPLLSHSQLPTPPYMKPARSGTAIGDLFSPRRSNRVETHNGHGSIDYLSSPLRMGLDEDEDEDGRSVGKRSYVFRGKKVSATPESLPWDAKP